ncbi:Zn-dependent hydrolase [Candidatus Woesearchaeota archaeon CG1_02_33_12]|nr:MAG: Zn-dependent hydrolase [Candidatus Woesearchaeota archaeon CG1_02_33_12]
MLIGSVKIDWLGHSSFKITDKKVVYIDPYNIPPDEKADIILITHGHSDHCSIEDIKELIKDRTIILIPPDCQSKLSDLQGIDIHLVKPGKKIGAFGIIVEAVPAYNLNKNFHEKVNEWVGYIVNIAGKRIYHAGDTDFIPEMKELKEIDVALLPVGGKYTMDAKAAAEAANAIKPKVAVPMHYGSVVGSEADAIKFKELCNCEVEIMEHH